MMLLMLPAMLLFVVSTLVVFHFVLPANSSDLAAIGLLWVAHLFTALLGLSRAFAAEREQGVIDGLVLAPSDRSAIWVGKALSILAFLALVALFYFQLGASDPSRIPTALLNKPVPDFALPPSVLQGCTGATSITSPPPTLTGSHPTISRTTRHQSWPCVRRRPTSGCSSSR